MRIADMEVQEALGEVRGPKSTRRLEPQLISVLRALAEAEGRLLSRDELLNRAWSGRVVSDATLSSVISQLRRSLTEIGVRQVCIETLPKRGYRLAVRSGPPSFLPHRVPVGLSIVVAGLTIVGAFLAWAGSGWGVNPEAAMISLEITDPRGVQHSPRILIPVGEAGSVHLNDYDLDLEVRIIALNPSGTSMNLVLSSISHSIGMQQQVRFDEPARFDIRPRGSDEVFLVELNARPSDLASLIPGD
ncbi:winged helix-turn-helix domain-containing protein [Natronospira bacteriovora]|uniref:Winged helix-turn-helix domain-containing protein n=1 Tax=Natronospira bacteriovora TaxID=3069753 RepID=A0ABU0W6U1_9GAMM|nr:winged helix-turn-helix domain-containing protein [Natronospira sp. AB-CW4]MDQ2069746.1 winged helix-turn-helix domain-containing protein [Natronospira sp. AB-CW4]